MEIALSKIEDQFEVIVWMLIPCRNGRFRGARDRKVLKDICNEEINAHMSSSNGWRAMLRVGSNL